MRSSKTIALAATACALLLGASGPRAGAQSLPALITALADGPIQLRPVVLPRQSVPARAAVRAARRAIGVPFSVARAWPVSVKDREDLSGQLTHTACWLLASSRPFPLGVPGHVPRRETMYAVVEARTGLFREAFTKPRATWWRRLTPINGDLIRHLHGLDGAPGTEAVPATEPPRLPLPGTVRSPTCLPAAARADQLVARYFVYTDFDWKKLTNTPHGPQYELRIARQPVWYISMEGLNMPFVGPVPPPPPGQKMKTPPLPRTEELNEIISSTSGEEYETSQYRSGLRVDAAR